MRLCLTRAIFRLMAFGLVVIPQVAMHVPTVAAENAVITAASEAITTEVAKQHVSALADDTFEGRAAGTRGGRAAGLYVVKDLQAHGLKGAGLKGFYQPFDGGLSNILAVLEGSDPELKDQYILIGAHYDHVGYGNARNSYGPTGYIHNGADDNASGVAGLLDAIAAFAKLPQAPRRSILFAFWDGEEAGLLGSKYWVEHPTVPLKQVVANINVDMIGRLRGNKLEVFGSRTARGFRRLVSEQNTGVDLNVHFDPELKANSDHHSFYSRQIPYLFLHTGLHNDYHRPSDDVDKINSDGIRQAAVLLFKIGYELADQKQANPYRTNSRGESVGTLPMLEHALAPLPGRLGLTWDERAAGPGVVVSRVNAGGPAANAGLRTGDRILRVAGREITSSDKFRSSILAAANPVALSVERRGSDEPLDLKATLLGSPVRIGLTWREDEAEPESVIISRVVPGSPAYRAGLHAGERIYQVNGTTITGSANCSRQLAAATGPVELAIETAGHVRTVKLEPLTVLPAE